MRRYLPLVALVIILTGCTQKLETTASPTINPTVSISETQEPVQSSTSTSSSRPSSSPAALIDWKTFAHAGLTIKYPKNWQIVEDQFISEKSFVPGEQDKSKIYNIVEIQGYSDQITAGYTNQQWFDKINALTAPLSSDRDLITKLSSGKVTSGDNYVVFKLEPSTSARGDAGKYVRAYVLRGMIYQLTLSQYDQAGIETFQQMIPTININK